MKKIYSTIMMLAMMVAALSFTACGGDDEDDDMGSVNHSSLVGTWKTVYAEGWGYSIGEEDGLEYLQFKKDGSFIDVMVDEDGINVQYGLWKVIDNDLVLKMNDGELAGSSFVYKILDWGKEKITISIFGATGYLQKVSDSVIQKYL